VLNQINIILDLIKQKSLAIALDKSFKLYNQYPKNYDVTKVYAYTLMLSKDYLKSEQIFRELYNIKSKDFDILNNLGHIYVELEKFEEAEKFLFKAKEFDVKNPSTYANLAALMVKTSKYQKAINFYNNYFNLIGGEDKYILEDTSIIMGYLDSLIAVGEKNIAQKKLKLFLEKKFNEELFYYYIQLNKEDPTSEEINNLVSHYSKTRENSVIETNRKYAAILFSAALYYEKINIDLSEKYYYEGNKKISDIQRFMPLEYQKKIKNIKTNYQKSHHIKSTDPNKGKGIVFIVGLPRSGTTLVESIIANNKNVQSGGELISMMSLCSDFYNENLQEINQIDIDKIGDDYISRVNYIREEKKIFIDKLPGNYFNMGFINSCLPQAKFVLIKRNLWDVAISQFKQYYIANIPYSSKFFNIAVECANFEEIVKFWLKKEFEIHSKVYTLDYETLVSNEVEVANKIFSFLDFNEKYIGKDRDKFFSRTASRFQIQNKINDKSVEKRAFEDSKSRFFADFNNQKEFWSKGL
tara:strand:- start:2538 stop:4112 length:1575 start_codon:yes stop_codon:yes gene_type:complete